MIADNQSGRRDGFISHASEDKNAIARPLAEALRRQGYGIWYDESELRLGDSLHDAIERGLATCRFGIVILSPAFLQKQWTTKELEGLFVREIDERRKIILPVWHGIAGDEILRRYPMLAVKKAISTAEGLEAVVREISRVLGPPAPGLVHHSDRGVQYASQDYTDLLKSRDITISMSRKGNPFDNAACESFMKTLKYEEVYRQEYRDLAEARASIKHFLERVYNRKRLHSALG